MRFPDPRDPLTWVAALGGVLVGSFIGLEFVRPITRHLMGH